MTLTIEMIQDEVSKEHSLRVNKITRIIAEKATEIFPQINVEMIEMVVLYHDIGKAQIPSEILTKPGRLTDEEFQIIKGHSLSGAEMIQKME